LPAPQLVDFAISAVLGLIMFGVGLSLTITDFTRIVRYPRAFFTALTIQMVGLPLIAFGIALWISPLPDAMKVGFIVLSAGRSNFRFFGLPLESQCRPVAFHYLR
jgi:BASS family bile acid:Na+ symporter